MISKIVLSSILIIASSNAMAVEKDKQKHLAVSTAIGAGSTYFFDDYRYSFATCMTFGLAKEIYDEIDYGGFDGKDLAYDALGCGLGVLTGEVIKFHIQDDGAMISLNYNF